jgi:hypothetical protein
MAHFLLIYDRDAGRLVRNEEHVNAAAAFAGRVLAETEFANQPDIEIVAVTAESEDELRATHGRYFLDLSELAARIG